jgi:hypothetical protein
LILSTSYLSSDIRAVAIDDMSATINSEQAQTEELMMDGGGGANIDTT